MNSLVEQVSAAALRALGRNPAMQVILRGKRMRVSGATIHLPRLDGDTTGAEYRLLRGRLDAVALRSGYSDARLHEAGAPDGKMAGKLHSTLEQCRVEAIGARDMAGVSANIRALQAWRLRDAGIREIPESLRGRRLEAVVLIARHCLGAPLPRAASAALAEGYADWLEPGIMERIAALAPVRRDQAAFADRAARLVDALRLSTSEPRFEREAAGRVQSTAERQPAKRARADDVPRWDPTRGDLVRQPRRVVERLPDSHAAPDASAPYRIYNANFDEVVDAAALCGAGRLAKLRRQLDAAIPGELHSVTRLAHRLQRYLMARQTRAWKFDLEEGLLDASRLTRIVVNPVESLAYKQETETRFIDTAVTLLIDNSGSMRGEPIAMAAVCAEILGKALERCGVKSEILGFTTRRWRGGRIRDGWLAAGRPARPRPAQRAAAHHLQARRHSVAAGAAEPRPHAERGPPEGEYRW